MTGYADLPPPDESLAPGQVDFGTGIYSGEAIRVASVLRVVLAGAQPVPVIVTVAQTRQGVNEIAAELSRLAAALSVAFFIIAVGLSAIAARTSLGPLNEIAAAVSRRGPSDLRPLRRAAPAELAPLMTALNRLMERLGQSIRRSEDFIAEAAHRVRTPLATVRTQAEIALHRVNDETERQRLRGIIRAVDESSRSAGQLLDHAMVAYRVDDLAREPVDLAALARQTAATLEVTASVRDIRLHLDLAPVRVAGDAVLLDSALRNVLDNAIKYSPEDTCVAIRIAESGTSARITITDEGPGLGDGPAEALTERFRRGSNTGGVVGSGLGLTIARDVAEAHGRHLELQQAENGRGACVSLVLPLA